MHDPIFFISISQLAVKTNVADVISSVYYLKLAVSGNISLSRADTQEMVNTFAYVHQDILFFVIKQ